MGSVSASPDSYRPTRPLRVANWQAMENRVFAHDDVFSAAEPTISVDGPRHLMNLTMRFCVG